MCLVIAVVACAPAVAFYPFGGWDTFGTLRLEKWKLSDFDLNNDGNVTPDEGREVRIEGGPTGFNPAEIEIVRQSLQVWEDVPTTYASFRVRGIFQDPTLPTSDLGNFDTVSSIYLQVTEADDTGEDVIPDPGDVVIPDIDAGVLGINLSLFSIDEQFVEISGQVINIPAGTIIDSDIVIAASGVRANGASQPPFDLQSIMVHELGHFLGLGHPALSNLRPEAGGLTLLESPVLPYTPGNGIQRLIGVTPTMFPIYFSVVDEQNRRVGGGADLAPDDISGISWLYPRGSQAGFFNVAQEARTETRPQIGLPSVPILGGHVVAWADQDGNPDTPRVPVFGTMTGLYQQTADPQLEGRFNMINMWKQVEIQGSSNIFRTPDYVFTLSPLSGLFPDVEESFIRQSPVGITPDAIDSLHLADLNSGDNARALDDYYTSFASEVYQEVENIIDVSNRDAGTALIWSFEQNTFVSVASGKTLATLLPNNRPMFGDPNDICPLFVTEIPSGGTGVTTTTGTAGFIGNNRLRAFRDDILLKSALGTVAVNAYYQAAPAISAFLLRHEYAFAAFRGAKLGVFWMIDNALLLAALTATMAAATMLAARRRRLFAALGAGAAVWIVLAFTASAQLANLSTADYVSNATDIVSGQVVSTEPRWDGQGRIFTDITVSIDSAVKGTGGKATGSITFSVLGGKKDGFVMNVSELASFRANESVVLYLREYKPGKYTVFGGYRGKVLVSGSGSKKYVSVEPEVQKAIAEKKGKAATATGDEPARTSLDDYLDYIRGIVEEQEAASK